MTTKKQKFKYNPDSLSYDIVEKSWREGFVKVLLVLAPAVILGFIFAIIGSYVFKSPYEQALENENVFLKEQLDVNKSDYTLALTVLKDIEKRDNEIYRVIFNAKPFPDEVRQLGTGGTDEYAHLEGYNISDKVKANAKMLRELEKKLYAQSLSFDEVIKLAMQKEQMLGCVPAIQPVTNEDLTRMASGFGWRVDPIYNTSQMHWGIDFTADVGTNVYATGNGVVEEIQEKKWGYGNCVIINHGFGYRTWYAHLSAFNCKQGDKITRGDVIGFVGSTGKSTAPHLHYEVEKNGQKINPIHFFHSDITAEGYERLLEMSENANQAFD